jgi:hypothetical protein
MYSAPFGSRREINTASSPNIAAGTVTFMATNYAGLSTHYCGNWPLPSPLSAATDNTQLPVTTTLHYHSPSREVQIELTTTFSKELISLKT